MSQYNEASSATEVWSRLVRGGGEGARERCVPCSWSPLKAEVETTNREGKRREGGFNGGHRDLRLEGG